MFSPHQRGLDGPRWEVWEPSHVVQVVVECLVGIYRADVTNGQLKAINIVVAVLGLACIMLLNI